MNTCGAETASRAGVACPRQRMAVVALFSVTSDLRAGSAGTPATDCGPLPSVASKRGESYAVNRSSPCCPTPMGGLSKRHGRRDLDAGDPRHDAFVVDEPVLGPTRDHRLLRRKRRWSRFSTATEVTSFPVKYRRQQNSNCRLYHSVWPERWRRTAVDEVGETTAYGPAGVEDDVPWPANAAGSTMVLK